VSNTKIGPFKNRNQKPDSITSSLQIAASGLCYRLRLFRDSGNDKTV
jgi:hypothetical protein